MQQDESRAEMPPAQTVTQTSQNGNGHCNQCHEKSRYCRFEYREFHCVILRYKDGFDYAVPTSSGVVPEVLSWSDLLPYDCHNNVA